MGHPDQGPALFIHFAMLKIVKLAHLLSTTPEFSCRMILQESFSSRLTVLVFFDWPMAGFFFFFFLKESCATGAGLSDSRSTCTAHRMRSHCCPRRNQHCSKSLESWLTGKTEIFRDELSSEHEHGCVDLMVRLAAFSSALPVPRELKA